MIAETEDLKVEFCITKEAISKLCLKAGEEESPYDVQKDII